MKKKKLKKWDKIKKEKKSEKKREKKKIDQKRGTVVQLKHPSYYYENVTEPLYIFNKELRL